MKITYIATELGVGGAESVTRLLLHEWRKEGHNLEVFLTYEAGTVAKQLLEEGFAVTSLGLARGAKAMLGFWKVFKIVQTQQPDIVIINNQSVLMPWVWALRFAKRGLRTVVALHSTDANPSRKERAFMGLTLPFYDRVVTLGNQQRQHYLKLYHPRPDHMVIVPNGIPPVTNHALTTPLPELPEDAVRGVILARLHPDKDHATLLKATRIVMDTHPNFHLFVVGSGESQDALMQQSKDLGLSNNVHFLGLRRDVSAILEHCQLGLLSSVTTETFSVAVLEYMRAALPVVSTQVGCIDDQILNGETGFVVPQSNPKALAGAISTLVENPALRTGMGAKNHARQQHLFTASKMATRYLEVFERDLNNQSAVWVGTSEHTRGGIASYFRTIRDSGLFERWNVHLIATHQDGNAQDKLLVFVRGLGQFLQRLLTRPPSIVHIHTASRASFMRKVCFFWLAKTWGIPVVLHVHGGEFRMFYDESPAPLKWLIRQTLTHANRVVSLGASWAERLRGIANNAKLEVVPNGILLPEDAPQERHSTPLGFLYLGKLDDNKNYASLLRAWKNLNAQDQARLVIAGDGEVEEARALAQELGIANSVEIPGWVGPDDVQTLLKNAHVFVLPSKNEGQPMSILEAMAHGLCVVATRVGGIPDMVEDNESGLLVAPNDDAALEDALRRVLNDAALRAHLVQNAYHATKNNFDVRVLASRIEALYRSIYAEQPTR